jgi:hypothetical protein
MTKMNWGRPRSQARMQRYGIEDVRGADIPFAAPSRSSKPQRRPPSKAAAAGRKVTVSCTNCPYAAIIDDIALRPGLRFRCSQCGALGTLAKKLS